MSMMLGIILDGDVYLAADRRYSYYNPKTKEDVVIGDVEGKMTVLDKYTVMAANGACFYTDTIQKIAPNLWKKARGDIDKFRIIIKNEYNAINKKINIIPQDIRNDTKFMKNLCAKFIIAHYDIISDKPILYALNDYNNFNEITLTEQNCGTIASSANDDIMWSILKGLKVSSPIELIKIAFMACSQSEPSIGDKPEILKINQKGVQKI